MRHSHLVALIVVAASAASGCVVVRDNTNNNPPIVTTCTPPTFDNFQGNYNGFGVSPGSATQIPPGESAFAVTASGNGTFRLTWTDTNNFSTCFTGLVTSLTPFRQSDVQRFSGQESLAFNRDNQIAFASVPGDAVDGIDFFVEQDPVYIDVFADNSTAVNIYFTDSLTGLVSTTGVNPAAFSSP